MAFWGKDSLERGLGDILGPDGLLREKADVACYGFDSSGFESEPRFVALPGSIQQVCKVAKLCNDLGVAITPRGAGSSTTGSAVPARGGVVLCFSRMNRILEIDPVELTARVEPGVVTGVLKEEVARHGLFYPPDPASLKFCTIGGNVATGAGGPMAVKYGVTRDYVRRLKIVLADGSLVETGAVTSKGVVGYDLARFLVGSEGTLAIVVEIVLSLIPMPEAVGTVCACFRDVGEAVDALTYLFLSGTLPRCAEFLDTATLTVVSDRLAFDVPRDTGALLLVEVDGDGPSVENQFIKVKDAFANAGALSKVQADTAEEREQLWRVRRGVSPALKGLGYEGKVSEDICVPRRAVKEMLFFLHETERLFPVKIFCFGHLGDGNIHVNLLFNSSELVEQELNRLIGRIMKKCVGLGGTISGEHGIGLSKMDHIGMELPPRVIGLERKIKRVFDPRGILNPYKIFRDFMD